MKQKGFQNLNDFYKEAKERYLNDEVKRSVGFYAIIPTFILEEKTLTANEKLLYGEISALANKGGFCYAKNDHLKKSLNCGIITIKRALKTLTDLNLIEIEIERSEKGTYRKIWLTCGKPVENSGGVVSK